MYKLCRIQDIHTLYATCGVCTVFAVHQKYIVEVLQKTTKPTEMIDHSLERKFYGACTMD